MNKDDENDEAVAGTQPTTIRDPITKNVIDDPLDRLRTSTRQGRQSGRTRSQGNRQPTEIKLQRPRGGASADTAAPT
jgi:hypothetical protein